MTERRISFSSQCVYVGEFCVEFIIDSWGGITFRVVKGYDRLFHNHSLSSCIDWCKKQPIVEEPKRELKIMPIKI